MNVINNFMRIAAAAGKLVLAFVLAFVLTLVAMVPVAAMIAVRYGNVEAMTMDRLLNDPLFTFGSMIAQGVGFIAAVPIMYALFERKRGWPIGWKKRGAVADLARGMGIGVVLMTAIFLIMLAFGTVRIEAARADGAVWRDMAAYLLLFALVSLNEELFSRGYVQGLIRDRFGAAAGIACSSILFALLHAFNPGALEQPLPLINIFVAGVLLGVCREASGSLWLPIGLHWTWNYVQGNVFGYEVSGTKVVSPVDTEPYGSPIWSGGTFGAEGSLTATIIMIAAIWFVWRTRRPERNAA
ncbi:CPBP family intramembrane glutamic endopeptidase [Paenibacillus sp. GYB003]|uniref:CPBP family intramembrane glutamic endopeptidase n=1 Tax=Paenibacillus sp. GYB003 TaxID=2994392 RepID=UPI002F965DD8